ncbi:hypothetical protein BDV59DRAFT_201857 [Aspergillus ambiguus]|uniref:uncharacterized protein n=1 Tax=Aspergillus ambiguus TaxID=176160 RepID=UPI003CCE00AA
MRFLSLLALAATALAVPAELGAQQLCLALEDRGCSNSTVDYTCCVPLVCDSNAVCQEPY